MRQHNTVPVSDLHFREKFHFYRYLQRSKTNKNTCQHRGDVCTYIILLCHAFTCIKNDGNEKQSAFSTYCRYMVCDLKGCKCPTLAHIQFIFSIALHTCFIQLLCSNTKRLCERKMFVRYEYQRKSSEIDKLSEFVKNIHKACSAEVSLYLCLRIRRVDLIINNIVRSVQIDVRMLQQRYVRHHNTIINYLVCIIVRYGRGLLLCGIHIMTKV